MHRTPMETEWLEQGQPPWRFNRLRDFPKVRTGQYPSPAYLGVGGLILK